MDALTDLWELCRVHTETAVPSGVNNTLNNCFASAVVQALLACPTWRSFFWTLGSRPAKEILDRAGEARDRMPTTLLLASLVHMLCDAGTERHVPASTPVDPHLTANQRRRQRKKKERGKTTQNAAKPVSLTQCIADAKGRSSRIEETITALLIAFCSYCGDTVEEFVGRQQDSHEFLHFIIEKCHEELELLVVEDKQEEEEDGWLEVGNKKNTVVQSKIEMNDTIMKQLFGGQLRMLLSKRGQKDSVSYQPFFSIAVDTVDIRGKPLQSLEACLDAFCVPTLLESQTGTRMARTTEIMAIGDALCIQLKRFVYDAESQSVHKVGRFISYPPQIQVGSWTGRLKAIVSHHGSSYKKGHYTAVCKHGSLWVMYDDDTSKQVSSQEAANQHAYMLLYHKL